MSPGSIQYVPMTGSGYQEISKRHWGSDTYKFPINRSNGVYTIGEWVNFEITLEWLANPTALRITTYKNGVLDFQWTDTGDTTVEPGGEVFNWICFPAIRADASRFEIDSYVVERLV